MERRLKIRLRADAWRDEQWLPRFVRTLEAGGCRPPRWQLSDLDDGWEARADRSDRTQRIRLVNDQDDDWTLTVETGPREARALAGGEWWIGAALGVAAFVVGRARLGTMPALAAAIAVMVTCGILPHLARRPAPLADEPDPVDEELLDRVRRGAEAFTGFQVLDDWREP